MPRPRLVALLATGAVGLAGVAHAAPPDLSARAQQNGGPAAALAGTEWRLERLGGRRVEAGLSGTLQFRRRRNATAVAPCNTFFARYRVRSGRRLRFDIVGATRVGCIGASARVENRFVAAIERTRRYRRGDGRLFLIGRNGRALARLRREG